MITTVANFLSSWMPPASEVTPSSVLTHSESSLISQDRSNSVQQEIDKVANEMNRRATNIGYGLGAGLRKLIGEKKVSRSVDILPPTNQESRSPRLTTSSDGPTSNNSFINTYNQIFLGDSIRVLYAAASPGVDNAMALVQLLTAVAKGQPAAFAKKISLEAVVPTVGNVLYEQSVTNTFRLLGLTLTQGVKVFPGSIAPLPIEGNQTEVARMNEVIDRAGIYGSDGLEGIQGWPDSHLDLDAVDGPEFIAQTIAASPYSNPLTLVSTSALMNIAKAFHRLQQLEQEHAVAPGSFFGKIAAISIVEGCHKVDANTTLGVPSFQKNSNFYFDPVAAQQVFSLSQTYQVPIILLPLGLSEQPGLTWSSTQVEFLSKIQNQVAQQMSLVMAHYPRVLSSLRVSLHAIHGITCLTRPDGYLETLAAATIGSNGELQLDFNASDSLKNVVVLNKPSYTQSSFYLSNLQDYAIFNIQPEISNSPQAKGLSREAVLITAIAGGAVTLTALGFAVFRKLGLLGNRAVPVPQPGASSGIV